MKHIKQGSLLVQQKSSKLSVALESLQIQQLPPPLKWCSNIYPCFLSGSVQFLVFTLLLFVSLLISSLWHGQWWGIFFCLCCCLFSTIIYSLGLNISDQVWEGTCAVEGHCPLHAVWGRGLPAAYGWVLLTLLRHSPWLWLVVFSWTWLILANQITATGWSHRQWSVSYSTGRS